MVLRTCTMIQELRDVIVADCRYCDGCGWAGKRLVYTTYDG